MNKSRNFIERAVFDKVLAEVRRADGTAYRDIDTIYGDMSRLVVGWLARTPATRLHQLYNDLGWEGSANVRAIHEAAKAWYQKYDKREPDEQGAKGKQLPLKEAYEFAESNGLAEEVQRIKDSPAQLKTYTSSVRRGMIIELFDEHSLFEKFKAAHWPFGNTKPGKTVTERYRDIKREFDETKNHDRRPKTERAS